MQRSQAAQGALIRGLSNSKDIFASISRADLHSLPPARSVPQVSTDCAGSDVTNQSAAFFNKHACILALSATSILQPQRHMNQDVAYLQATQGQTLTMSGKVVGDDKKPEFPKQSQEFIGTVRSNWDSDEHMQAFQVCALQQQL